MSANLAGAIYFTGIMLGLTAIVLSRKCERWMAGMQHGVYRRVDAARRMSAGYLSRHPKIAAMLDDEREQQEDRAA